MEARCAAATRRTTFFSSFPLFFLLLLAGRYCHSECGETQEQSVGADHRGPAFVSLFDESGSQLTCPGQGICGGLNPSSTNNLGCFLVNPFGKPCRTTGLSHRPRDGPQRTRHASDKTHPQTRGQCAWQGKPAKTAGTGDVKGMKTADVTTAKLESP